jgi:ThiC-like protein
MSPARAPTYASPCARSGWPDSISRFGPIAHDAVTVYHTSGPYTDPAADIDLAGLPPLRQRWIAERGDVEEQPADAFGERSEPAARSPPAFARPSWRANAGANVTQMHYARRGLITPEMEFVAIRENQRLDEALAQQGSRRPGRPQEIHPGAGALGGGARPRHPPGQYQPPGVRTHGHRTEFPGQDQRQYRELGGCLGGGGHGDGPLDRAGHPRHPRVDPAQLPLHWAGGNRISPSCAFPPRASGPVQRLAWIPAAAR